MACAFLSFGLFFSIVSLPKHPTRLSTPCTCSYHIFSFIQTRLNTFLSILNSFFRFFLVLVCPTNPVFYQAFTVFFFFSISLSSHFIRSKPHCVIMMYPFFKSLTPLTSSLPLPPLPTYDTPSLQSDLPLVLGRQTLLNIPIFMHAGLLTETLLCLIHSNFYSTPLIPNLPFLSPLSLPFFFLSFSIDVCLLCRKMPRGL